MQITPYIIQITLCGIKVHTNNSQPFVNNYMVGYVVK